MWKDTTSFSQGDKEKVPNIWTLRTDQLTISLVRNHRMIQGQWVMHCTLLAIDTLPIGLPSSEPIEVAQEIAITKVRDKLSAMMKSIEDI
jgi:hypothetical protein